MSTSESAALWRWTHRLTRIWLTALVLTSAAGVLFLLDLSVPAGIAIWLGLLGLLTTTWALMMLSAAREYQAGQWPDVDARRGIGEIGNPAIYEYFGRVVRGMLRW